MRCVNTLEPNATLKSNLSACVPGLSYDGIWNELSDWDHLKQSLIWCRPRCLESELFIRLMSECVSSGISNCIFNTCLQALDSQKKCLTGTFACYKCILHSVLSSVAALHLNHQLNLNLGKYQKQSLKLLPACKVLWSLSCGKTKWL